MASGDRTGGGPSSGHAADPLGEAVAAFHPSLSRALHGVVVAEVLVGRLDTEADVDEVAMVVAETLEYTMELAATSLEGKPVTHGVVVCADRCGLVPVHPRVDYPGRFPTRKRTPLLFDGTEWSLVVTETGAVLGEVSRRSAT